MYLKGRNSNNIKGSHTSCSREAAAIAVVVASVVTMVVEVVPAAYTAITSTSGIWKQQASTCKHTAVAASVAVQKQLTDDRRIINYKIDNLLSGQLCKRKL